LEVAASKFQTSAFSDEVVVLALAAAVHARVEVVVTLLLRLSASSVAEVVLFAA
jgi:hypothetical protein